MSRTLHLLRHAKSSWDDPAATDHERPLAPRGRRAAAAIAGHLRDERIAPALVLCSSAVRTRQTLARVSAGFDPGCDVRIEIEGALYDVSAAELLTRIRRVADDVGSVMLIGHEPAIGELALTLAGPGSDAGAAGAAAGEVPDRGAGHVRLPGRLERAACRSGPADRVREAAGTRDAGSVLTTRPSARGPRPGSGTGSDGVGVASRRAGGFRLRSRFRTLPSLRILASSLLLVAFG